MDCRIRRQDWSATAPGPVECWPQAVQITAALCLQSSVPMAVWLGPELATFYNDAWAGVIGNGHPGALGAPARQCWRAAWDAIGPMAESVLRTGAPARCENLPLLFDRHGYPEECYLTFSFSPIPDGSGTVAGVFAMLADNSETIIGERRRETLRELAKRNMEAESEEDALGRAVAVVGANASDVPFAAAYLADGAQWRRVAGQNRIAETSWPLERAAQSGRAVVAEDQSAVLLPAGPNGLLVAGISPDKALDEHYLAFYDEISALASAGVKNAAAHREAGQRAQALVQMDRARTAFFSNISHELRTPLALMLGPVEDALRDGDAPAWLTLVHRNALRILRLVDSLLDLSRLEAGRVRPEPAPTDLAQLTTELAGAFHSVIEAAGLRFLVDCEPLPQAVAVDREMWEKIVFNLLSNAYKYTMEGEIAVGLRQTNGTVELRVRDSGCGIPADEVPHLFERFHRVRGGRGRTENGAGIGLALVDELARLHGGTVGVETRVGAGSTFTVSIPVVAGVNAATAAPGGHRPAWVPEIVEPPAEGAVSSAAQPGTRARILLADDNADMREYLTHLLEVGYEVIAAAGGDAALDRARELRPDVILADVMMPGLDGFELLRALRADPATSTVPVILLSARAGEASRLEGLQSGADDYLVKPFTARELLARVGVHLRMAQLRREAAAAQAALRAQQDAERERTVRLLESLDEAFVSFDGDWRYTFMNRKAEELSGKTREELIGRVVWEVFPEAVGNELYTQLHRVAAERQPAHIVGYQTQAERWVEADAYPSDGGVAVVVRDVSERKRHERMQAEQLKRFQAVYATADAVSSGRTLDEIYVCALQGMRTGLGVSAAAVLTCDSRGALRLGPSLGVSSAGRAAIENYLPWPRGATHPSTVKTPDVEAEPGLKPYLELFRREGIGALAFVPIAGGEGLLGAFVLQYPHARQFPDDELRVAETIASHVAFATERKLGEDAVRQAKDRLQDILDSIAESFIALDRDWRFTYVSRSVLSSTGLPKEELLRRTIWEVFPELVDTEFYTQYHRVMNERVPMHCHVYHAPTAQWFELYAHPTPEGMSAHVLDISVQKRAQDALLESEQRYRFLAEAMPQFVWISSAGGATEFLNQYWCDYTGISRDTELGEVWPSLVHPDDLESSRKAWQEGLASDTGFEQEFRIRHAGEGRYRWQLCRTAPVRNDAGEVVQWVSTAIDIDDRKRAEEALRESERRAQEQYLELHTLYETAPVGLSLVDRHLRFLRINEQLAALHGLPVAAHLGQRIGEVLPRVGRVLEPLYEQVLRSRQPIDQVEVQIEVPDGAPREWLVSLFPLMVDTELLGVSAVVQDVTAHKEFERNLRETQKLEAVGVLAGGVAHDFNNLLTGILGNASMALESCTAGMARECLTDVIAAGERAAALTQQLLAYSGKGKYVVEPVDVSALTAEIRRLVRTSIPRNVDVSLELQEGLPPVEGDPAQLHQLIMNLVINAAEAIDPQRPGMVRVTTGVRAVRKKDIAERLRGAERMQDGIYVFITVTDNGRGMDAATIARIFDPFFTTKFTGRGLGLAAAIGIVRGHGGAIALESEPGKGSEFTVLLPVSGAAVAEDREDPEARVEGCATILIVDDEEFVLRVAQAVLESRGYGTVVAENGLRAVETLRHMAGEIDAVLLDVTMPVMGGAEALERMRTIRPDIPVIICSGHSEREALRQFGVQRVEAFIQKPFTGPKLADAVAQLLAVAHRAMLK